MGGLLVQAHPAHDPRGAEVDRPPGVVAPPARPAGRGVVVDGTAGTQLAGEAPLRAARGGDRSLRQVGTLLPAGRRRPGAQVGLGTAQQVVDDLPALRAVVAAHVLDPVRDHPVVGDAVAVVVPDPLTGHLPVDAPGARHGGEGVDERCVGRVVTGRRRPAEAVHVHAEAVADVVLLPDRPLGVPLLDELLGTVAVLGDEPAEPVDPLGEVLVHPRVARDDAGVGLGLEDLHRPRGRLDALVVDLDHEVAVHHPAQGVLAQRGQPAPVAVRPLRVDRQHLAGDELGDLGRDDPALDGVVVQLRPAALHLPELPGRQEVADVDDDALGPGVEAHPAQRVVELMAQVHRADPELLGLVETGVDLGLGAVRDAQGHAAAEGSGDLHAEDDGHLALLDVAPGLLRRVDDAEPALARAAVARVDEGLELLGLLHLATHDVHVVARAGVDLGRQRAQDGVVDRVGDHDPLATAPGALHPPVVHLLVGERGPLRGVLEGRVEIGVVRVERTLALEVGDVLDEAGAAIAAVAVAVGEGVLDAELAEGLAADDVAAEALVGHQVGVRVDEATHLPLRPGPGGRRPRDAELGVLRQRVALLVPGLRVRARPRGAAAEQGDEQEQDEGGQPSPRAAVRCGHAKLLLVSNWDA